ncbi:MAG: hypothetical protein C0594_11840, partial [Marinilabiliales bacterium]
MAKHFSKNLDLKVTLISIPILLFIYFIILGVALEMIDMPYSYEGFIAVHKSNFVLYAIEIIFVAIPIIIFISLKVFLSKNKKLIKYVDNQKKREQSLQAFANQLIDGNIEAYYEIDDSNDDNIGSSLIKLRDHLKSKQKEDSKRQKEDEQRNWSTSGQAKFGEILRQDNDNLEALSFNIVSNLVKYLDANQGGFFLINGEEEEERYFELTACYAYDRKKYNEKRIDWGDGLIGACALEMESIYLT